LNIRYINL